MCCDFIKEERLNTETEVNINRHNYEEFFLLYVDGELDTAQRNAVNVFIQQNPDLAEELAMLQDTVLHPEALCFHQKDVLFRSEEGITQANYEEYFLLATDNELSPEDQQRVEKFVLQHPQLQDEFTLLQQTRLPVEHIECPDKGLLYQTEEKRRIIPISWLRMSAAAAVIILITATWITQWDRFVDTNNPVATTTPAVKNGDSKKEVTLPMQAPKQATEQIASTSKESAEINSPAKSESSMRPVAVANVTMARNNSKDAKVIAPVENPPTQKLLPPTTEMMAALIRKTPGDVSGTPTELTNRNSSINQNAIASAKVNEEPNASITQTAVYKEFEEDEESKTIYLGAAEINRNKLKSIFKKASSLFERKEKNGDEDHTIRIASFQFKS